MKRLLAIALPVALGLGVALAPSAEEEEAAAEAEAGAAVEAAAKAAPPVAVYSLEGFEAGTRGWRFEQVEVWADSARAFEGGAALGVRFPAWDEGRPRWPALMLDRGAGSFGGGDWGAYDVFRFAVFNAGGRPQLLKLRLDDAEGKRVVHSFHLPPGRWRDCRVPVVEAAWGIDVSRVVHLNLYMTQPPEEAVLYFDALRLEALPLRPRAALLDDPLGEGRVGVRLFGGRRAQADITVLDAGGAVLDRYVTAAAEVEWRRRLPLPPGRYRVEAQMRDVEWDGEPWAGHLGDFSVAAPEAKPTLAAWQVATTDKVRLQDGPPAGSPYWGGRDTLAGQAPSLRFDMARNEYESAQVVLRSAMPRGPFSLRWERLDRDGGGAAFPLEDARVYPVGYVRTRRPDLYAVERAGWWPDPLLDLPEIEPQSRRNQPFWLELKSGADTAPGLYRGVLGLYRGERRLGEIPVEARVYDAVLPDSNAVGTAFAFYPDAVRRLYGGGDGAMLRRYWKLLAEHRIGLDHLYRKRPPSAAEMDHWEAGGAQAFNLLNIAPRAYSDAELEDLAAALEPAVEELRRRGLLHRAYLYGFDEARRPDFGALRRAFSFFKERFPDLRTFTTAIDPSLGRGSGLAGTVDMWAPLLPTYHAPDAEAARSEGQEVWWYICIAPTHPFPNWFIEYPAAGARLVWWMGYRQGVDGLLYYNINRWPGPRRPLRQSDGALTDWNPVSYGTANGDGCLLYGGAEGPLASLRLKLVRDGIEDVGLLHLLAKKMGDGGARARQLCDAVAPGPDEYEKDGAALAAARLALLRAFE